MPTILCPILYSPGLLGCGPLLGLKSYGREEPLLFYLWGMLRIESPMA